MRHFSDFVPFHRILAPRYALLYKKWKMVPVWDFFSYFYGLVLLANQVTSKFFKFKLLQYEKYKNQTIKK